MTSICENDKNSDNVQNESYDRDWIDQLPLKFDKDSEYDLVQVATQTRRALFDETHSRKQLEKDKECAHSQLRSYHESIRKKNSYIGYLTKKIKHYEKPYSVRAIEYIQRILADYVKQ